MAEKTKTKTDLGQEAKTFIFENSIAQQCLGMDDDMRSEIKKRLPDKKYYEFAWHMYFQKKFVRLEEEWKNWRPWDVWDWPVYDLNRFKKIVLDNLDIIHDRNVLDVGCHIGYISLILSHVGCRKVTGVDARKNLLDLAEFVGQQAGRTNLTFKKADMQSAVIEVICKDIDTVILPAVLHHVADHYDILSRITRSKASHVIIDNTESQKFYKNPTPQIEWTSEETTDFMNAYSTKQTQMVGIPNQAWIDFAMQDLGWRLEKDCVYYMMGKKNWPRCCSVWGR